MANNSYPADWPQIANAVKQLAGWSCEHCGHAHDVEAGYMLGVHHLDMDPANCDYTNLVALCQRCHLRWQATWQPGQAFLPGLAIPIWLIKRGHAIRSSTKED
jgi:hypothetical protein